MRVLLIPPLSNGTRFIDTVKDIGSVAVPILGKTGYEQIIYKRTNITVDGVPVYKLVKEGANA